MKRETERQRVENVLLVQCRLASLVRNDPPHDALLILPGRPLEKKKKGEFLFTWYLPLTDAGGTTDARRPRLRPAGV